jgi:hypothetical protein
LLHWLRLLNESAALRQRFFGRVGLRLNEALPHLVTLLRTQRELLLERVVSSGGLRSRPWLPLRGIAPFPTLKIPLQQVAALLAPIKLAQRIDGLIGH